MWRNLGAAYFQLDRYDEAASAFQRALEIAPTAATYTNLGTLRFYQGRYHDAVPAFEKAVELGANRSLYWGNLADAYRWAPGRRADSIAAYERAITLLREEAAKQPTVVELRSRLATYLVKSNQTAAALDADQGHRTRASADGAGADAPDARSTSSPGIATRRCSASGRR